MNNGMNNTNYNGLDNSGMSNQNFNNQPINNGMSNQNFNGQVNNTMPNQGYNGQINNGMNNQNFNNQPMNNAMANQGYGGQVNNTMPNQGYNGQINNGMNNQNFNSQPVNNMMPNQPINNDMSAIKQNKKPIYIIIGVALLTVVVVGVLFFVNNNGTTAGGGTEEKIETVTFNGFSIPKKAGYSYNVRGDAIGISKDKFMLMLTTVAVSFKDVKNKSDDIMVRFTTDGLSSSNFKVATYNGKEVATIEGVVDGAKILYCIMDAGNNNVFFGLLYDSETTYNYDNVNTFVSLLKDAKYTGSKATSGDTDLSSIQDFLNGLGK